MNKFALLSFLLILLFMTFASAYSANLCSLNVSLINQDPYPTVPDSHVKVVFQVSGVGDSQCEGAKFKLIPKYPFSLDENKSWIILEEQTYVSGYKNNWMIPYSLRVDKDALDESAEIEVYYSPGNWKLDSYSTKKFNITVQDSRTNFDAVLQEVSGNEVSIAIANTGKYTANSVVVRIPEQESYRATGIDGQMVGNLESGDYTIVGFSVSPKSAYQNISRRNMPASSQGQAKLKFDIYYTDNIGERRIVSMELPLNMNAGNFSSAQRAGNFAGRSSQTSSAWYSSWLNWIIILGILIAGFIIYKKYPKIKSLFKGKNSQNNPNKIPDWLRNAKEKEKNK